MLDEKAQLSMDFLGGFVIAFFSLVTVLIFLPTLFSTLQNPSIDLYPVAYRTGVLLAEDPGWWVNVSAGEQGYDWEDNLNNTSRIGLASVKYGKGDPCALDRNKTLAFITLYSESGPASYEKIQDLLGLKSSIRRYDYNITFRTLRDNLWVINVNNTYANMTFGKEIPTNGNVEKVVRIFKIGIGDFYPEAPSMNPPGVQENWWPNWPTGHPFDTGSVNGQLDRPIPMNSMIDNFIVYNIRPATTNTSAQMKFEMFITNDSSIDNNNNLRASGVQVVDWIANLAGDPWNQTGTGNAFNSSTWLWREDNGKYKYDFAAYIQAVVDGMGWNGQDIYMTIYVKNIKGNVSSPSFILFTAPPNDPWIEPIENRLYSIKLEVCVW